MKQIFYYSALIVLLASCAQTNDKKAELEKLKAQREKLDTQIEQLEKVVNPNGENQEIKPVSVAVTAAAECVFNHYIQVQGTVDGDQNIAVSPQTAGIVTAVYVREGEQVKKGGLLAELDPQVVLHSIDEVNTQLELANSLFEKQSALWAKNIGSEVQYLQAKSNKETLEKRIATLKEQLKMTKILSPIDGTIESVPLRVGQMATPGLASSTIRVINMDNAKISADVSETYAASIRTGNATIVSFPDIGKEINAKLNFTSKFIDPTDRTFKVECKVSSNDVELRANMIAYLKINDYTNKEAFCVPVNYIQNDRAGKYIYIATKVGSDWVADRRKIKTGMDYDGVAEILDGLKVGDKIITIGFQGLTPGAKVVF